MSPVRIRTVNATASAMAQPAAVPGIPPSQGAANLDAPSEQHQRRNRVDLEPLRQARETLGIHLRDDKSYLAIGVETLS